MTTLTFAKLSDFTDALRGSLLFPAARTSDFAAGYEWRNTNNTNYNRNCGGGGMAA